MSVKSAVSYIGAAARRFSGRPLELSSKFLGAGTLAAVIYDAHINGKEAAIARDSRETADRYERNFEVYEGMSRKSASTSYAKGLWFRMRGMSSWKRLFSRAAGYLEGAGKTIAGDIPQIILSIIALSTKNHKTAGKISGVLLALNAAKTFVYDIAGIGRDKKV